MRDPLSRLAETIDDDISIKTFNNISGNKLSILDIR
jgi:hypothetical protein